LSHSLQSDSEMSGSSQQIMKMLYLLTTGK
jgi:hypothetical protein